MVYRPVFMRLIAPILAILSSAPVLYTAQADASSLPSTPAGLSVLELFTSAGCGDAGPADALLRAVDEAQDASVLALSCHVSHMDPEDKPGVLSRNFCDERYGAYVVAGAIAEDYALPRMMLNGRFELSGSQKHVIDSGLKMARVEFPLARISMDLRGDHLDATLPDLGRGAQGPFDLWLAAYKHETPNPDLQISIDAGAENPTKSYRNMISHLNFLKSWDGGYRTLTVEQAAAMDADGFAILAQQGPGGPIIAAGFAEINPAPR